MIKESLKFLVADGYGRASRIELGESGMSTAGELYKKMLLQIAPNSQVDIATPADAEAYIPKGVELKSYDGVALTGSNLSVLEPDNPAVRSQLDFQREVFKQGVPSFGSCWALQVGTVVAGGKVGLNPKGREMGFARKIRLTTAGRKHPLYQNKNDVFDGFASHEDEIFVPPPNSQVLAGNSISDVQSMEINCGNGVMWALQYHPEYDTREMAALMRCRDERLIGMGFFTDKQDLADYTTKLDQVCDSPNRKDLRWSLGIDSDILDQKVRQVEVFNWINSLVLPNSHR